MSGRLDQQDATITERGHERKATGQTLERLCKSRE